MSGKYDEFRDKHIRFIRKIHESVCYLDISFWSGKAMDNIEDHKTDMNDTEYRNSRSTIQAVSHVMYNRIGGDPVG